MPHVACRVVCLFGQALPACRSLIGRISSEYDQLLDAYARQLRDLPTLQVRCGYARLASGCTRAPCQAEVLAGKKERELLLQQRQQAENAREQVRLSPQRLRQ